jgi:hypothetical protein
MIQFKLGWLDILPGLPPPLGWEMLWEKRALTELLLVDFPEVLCVMKFGAR